MTFYPIDWHTPIHLFGSFFLVKVLIWLDTFRSERKVVRLNSSQQMSVKLVSAMWAFGLGMIWEMMDSWFAGQWIFDARGGDWSDVIADMVGCMLAVVI